MAIQILSNINYPIGNIINQELQNANSAKMAEQQIFELQAKIEHAENHSFGSIEDESRLDDLYCELLQFEEAIA